MSIKIDIWGAGAFSRSFIPLFKAHSLVQEVLITDFSLRSRASGPASS
jgi:hypothetical protein